MSYTVKEVAALAGITVRTLHHYDAIGLLEPAARGDNGYRLYAAPELERLQQILFYRELDFPLEEIRRLMGDPGFDRVAALVEQRRLLAERRTRLSALIESVDAAIAAAQKGAAMDEKEMFEVFGDFDPAQYEDEVRDRWGDTDAYRESARRTSAYTKEDWARIKAEGDAINEALAGLLDQDLPPSDPRVQEVVERHWRSIDENFYRCPPEMYRGLGEMYVQDARFSATYDAIRPGLAVFLRDAIRVWVGARGRAEE